MPADPAPIRGRWTMVRCRACGRVAMFSGTLTCDCPGPKLERFEAAPWPPVPDEAAIERGAKARWDRDEQREVTRADGTLYRAVAWEAAHELDRAEYRAEALAVLRAALEAPE